MGIFTRGKLPAHILTEYSSLPLRGPKMMPHHMHLQQRRLFSGTGSDSSSQISAISTGTPAPLCEQISKKDRFYSDMETLVLSPELVQPYAFQFTYGSSISIYNQIAKLIGAQDGQLSPHLIFD